ncbi:MULTISPECIES: DUF1573 domain-containing protein [unclassified Spirosoma]|uniref:DUF1573 domain-containing protein n=1 Tax=unclassified Spirosoma TaxID=2621999 RepID=UPI000963CDB7|nr:MULTISPECIES: DUF1573 domain-containing protein [unclassified Spirosoma]MBN8824611.1 DUF1573 domain-containing protein [Spirosoma sp.]OJW78834.1 MAG: hypothetical protein BGO59_10160 [Spirosoma sp. 48-14]
MKKIFSLFVALFVFVAVSYAQKGVLKFAKETHDFGKVEQGKPVTYVFEFKNTGADPVVISDAQASCGCTKPSWTREPVMPGKTGTVSATFNAAAMGPFNKSVTVTSNAEAGQTVLYLKGEVVTQKEAETAATPAATAPKKKTSR